MECGRYYNEITFSLAKLEFKRNCAAFRWKYIHISDSYYSNGGFNACMRQCVPTNENKLYSLAVSSSYKDDDGGDVRNRLFVVLYNEIRSSIHSTNYTSVQRCMLSDKKTKFNNIIKLSTLWHVINFYHPAKRFIY